MELFRLWEGSKEWKLWNQRAYSISQKKKKKLSPTIIKIEGRDILISLVKM